jgi:hypothetical protein
MLLNRIDPELEEIGPLVQAKGGQQSGPRSQVIESLADGCVNDFSDCLGLRRDQWQQNKQQ